MRGIRNVDDIKARCVIDDIAGCWVWKGGCTRDSKGYTFNPAIHIPPGVLGEKRQVTTGQKAMWLLLGRRLNPGYVVYRDCLNALCLCPSHLRSGTRSAMLKFVSDSGKNKGKPDRILVCERNRQHMLTPVEKVRAAERMFADGAMQKTVAEELKIDGTTARNIRLGNHPHSAGRLQGVRQASAFTWRPQ